MSEGYKRFFKTINSLLEETDKFTDIYFKLSQKCRQESDKFFGDDLL
jgi:hypothetical protein